MNEEEKKESELKKAQKKQAPPAGQRASCLNPYIIKFT